MKKILLILLMGVFLFGCSNNANNTPSDQDQKPSDQQQTDQTSDATTGSGIVYNNNEYGFDFALPDSWDGYTIVTDKWEGTSANDSQNTSETGPKISIRHPQWTSEKPRQDIPIMVFTLDQWDSMQKDEFHIGAAPINPSELGRNSKYVFALPARYNFAFPEGYEEVDTILNGKPLTSTENIGVKQ